MGSKGPFTVIQNSGANQYDINMVDVLAGKTAGKMDSIPDQLRLACSMVCEPFQVHSEVA